MKPILTLFIGLLVMGLVTGCDEEEGRIYTSRDPEECETLRFACVPGREPFFDEEGCGCELIKDLVPEKEYDIDDYNGREDINSPDTLPRGNGNINPDGQETPQNNRFDEDPIEQDLDQIQQERLEK